MDKRITMNGTNLTIENSTTSYNSSDLNKERHVSYFLQDVFYIAVTPAVSLFGCIGNILNIIVLVRSRLRMKTADGGRESGTLLGLLVLAASDMLFCAAVFPRAFAKIGGNEALFEPSDFRLYYQVYGTGVITTFILTSTWITVAMASLRYKGICHKLTATRVYSPNCIRAIYFLTVVVCVLVNLPTFWRYKITDFSMDGHVYYLIDIGDFALNTKKGYMFLWWRAIVGIFSPAVILVYCNCSLIIALRRSKLMRQESMVRTPHLRSHSRITQLLVVIVLLFIILVFPVELMDFGQHVIVSNPSGTRGFLLLRSVANFLQVVNFSCNFLVYCALNVHFRNTIKELVRFGRGPRKERSRSLIRSITKSDSTKQTWLKDLDQGPPRNRSAGSLIARTASGEKVQEGTREDRARLSSE